MRKLRAQRSMRVESPGSWLPILRHLTPITLAAHILLVGRSLRKLAELLVLITLVTKSHQEGPFSSSQFDQIM